MFAVCSIPTFAAPERTVAVVVEYGDFFGSMIGQSKANEAKALAEKALVEQLSQMVRYFRFVPSTQDAELTLQFKIDNSQVENQLQNVTDFYAFLTLREGNQSRGETLNSLFRDASDAANGAETAASISQTLVKVAQSLSDKIVEQQFSQVSFTNRAAFTSGRRHGWLIEHARNALCMHPDTKLIVESEIPDEGFQENFVVQVKRRSTERDSISMLSHADPQDQVDGLTDSLDGAKVVAVRVSRYTPQCEEIVEVSPSTVDFGTEG